MLTNMSQLSDNGKNEVPQIMPVPLQQTRSSGIVPYFLCDNAQYFLGLPKKGGEDTEKGISDAAKKFSASAKLHNEILESVDAPEARAILKFFEKWDPKGNQDNEVIKERFEKLQTSNLVFAINGTFAQDIKEIADAWLSYLDKDNAKKKTMTCLVTGRKEIPARIHPVIKGIRGGSSTGNMLVSFNANAFESYGREGDQGLNSPVGETSAQKYGMALNYLLSGNHVKKFADTTVVFWAETGEEEYQDIFDWTFDGDQLSDKDLGDILDELSKGNIAKVNERAIDGRTPFHILGLAPNSARLAVRFYLRDSFGNMLNNVKEHNERLEIIQPMNAHESLPLWKLIGETVRKTSTGKNAKDPVGSISAAVFRAVMQNTDYPVSLYQNVLLRINADKGINWRKAAIIKAYLLKNRNVNIPKEEVLRVELNKDCTYVPYVLGRMFAVLEKIQKVANPGINATIKDRYIGAASERPATVYPKLLQLSNHHLRKLSEGANVYYSRILTDLFGSINRTFPQHFDLHDQGVWYVGYYHQIQDLYKKNDTVKDKEEK